MTLWVSFDLGLTTRQPLEVLRRPKRFPTFYKRTTETQMQSAQRWRREYPKLSKAQHEYIRALVCYAIVDSKGIPSLNIALSEYEADLLKNRFVAAFSFNTAEPKEATINYKLVGSSRMHQLTVSTRSPSEDHDD